MRSMLAPFLLTTMLATASHAAMASGGAAPAIDLGGVSLVALIAQPERHDGRRVQVIGAMRLQTEGYEICLHEDDLARNIHKNCLWLELAPEQHAELAPLNGKYVILMGDFAKDDLGHMGLYSGALHRVDRVFEWPMP